MKNSIKLVTLALLTIALSFTSCSSDDDGGIPLASAGTITAKVGNKTITTKPEDSEAFLVLGEESNFFYILGTSADEEGFLMSITYYNGPGTYKISGENGAPIVACKYFRNGEGPNDQQSWDALNFFPDTMATITITEQTDKKIVGTFSFKGKNDDDKSFQSIKNGSFNLPLTTM